MKKTVLLGVCIFAVLAVIAVSGTVLAQRGPGGPGQMGPGMPPPNHTNMQAGTAGVFILAGPSLVKYNAATLKQEGTLQLLEKKDSTSTDQPPMPPAPADMLLVSGSNIVVVIAGDNFFIVDATALTVTAKGTLPKLQAPDQATGSDTTSVPCPPPAGRATIQVSGSTLYVLRADQLVAVNIKDGSIAAQTTLPKPPKPEDK